MRIVDYIVCPQSELLIKGTIERTMATRVNYKKGISGLCAGLCIGMTRHVLKRNPMKNDMSAPDAFKSATDYINSVFGVKNAKVMHQNWQFEVIFNQDKLQGSNEHLIQSEIEELHRRQKVFYINKTASDTIRKGCYLYPMIVEGVGDSSKRRRHLGAVWISEGRRRVFHKSLHSLCIYEPNCGLYLVEYGKGGEDKLDDKNCSRHVKMANIFLKGHTPKRICDALDLFYKSLTYSTKLPKHTIKIKMNWYEVKNTFTQM